MSTSNRAAKLTKTHKVLKTHYDPILPAERPLLEHLLYACCLEGAKYTAADEAFAKLQEAYFDWNEVRVTTIAELGEIMSCLPEPAPAASKLKRTLQSVFETYYSFELEALKKENIGQAVKKIQKLDGVSPFAVAYMTQHGLGGHAIPVSQGVLEAFQIVGVISEAEARQHRVPGVERAIPKSKGVEFASLLHQLGADYAAARFSSRVRGILLEIDPEAKKRFPKRASRKKAHTDKEPAAQTTKKRGTKKSSAKPSSPSTISQKRKKTATSKTPRTGSGKKRSGSTKKKSTTKRLSKKKPR